MTMGNKMMEKRDRESERERVSGKESLSVSYASI